MSAAASVVRDGVLVLHRRTHTFSSVASTTRRGREPRPPATSVRDELQKVGVQHTSAHRQHPMRESSRFADTAAGAIVPGAIVPGRSGDNEDRKIGY